MEIKRFFQVCYAILFCILLPIFLLWWTDSVKINLPAVHFPLTGIFLVSLGFVLLVVGMRALWKEGDGLPMNAFPPKKIVLNGVYALLPHPIYAGFVMMCLGYSLSVGSATGLWLTTPLVFLGVVSLVFGYEKPYLQKTFAKMPQPILDPMRIIKKIIWLLKLDLFWKRILGWTEKLANSWQQVRFGKLRIINHGIYGGLAGGLGAFLIILLAGENNWPSVVFLLAGGLVGAALWAQLVEGSSILLRPFGYYGGVLGVILTGLILLVFGKSVSLILAAFACVGPWVQAVGRLRCIIQGCCHGRETEERFGIKVINTHSRVSVIGGLINTPIHPTQLYSIVGNIFIGIFLFVLWNSGAPLSMIGGFYLIFSGLARFVEEAYRGEPQTKKVCGLPIYQWLSVVSVISGMLIMIINSTGAPLITFSFETAFAVSFPYFLVCWFALGMDFPESKVIFSRLSG